MLRNNSSGYKPKALASETLNMKLGTLALNEPLPALVVLVSSEPLLLLEAGDSLRQHALKQGFTEQHRHIMDARSNWQIIFDSASTGSLFGDRQLLEVSLPSGKPGKAGADALVKLAEQHSPRQSAQDVMTVLKLPDLDRATRESRWAKALLRVGHVIELPAINRDALPDWIRHRLATQHQSMSSDALHWLAERVEGNLLAAHQEILKLGVLYAQGEISIEQCQQAVLNVARYNVFDLRDAMLEGDSRRMLKVLWGLRAEGEGLPLVLWAVGEEIRTLAKVQEHLDQGDSLSSALKSERLFGVREQRARQALNRVHPRRWRRATEHAHEVDRIIKGISVAGRLSDPWHEMARLALSIAASRRG
jgi:DNA polymerase-3 subunit delta